MIFIFRKKVKFIYSAFIFLIIFSNGLFADILWRLLEHPWKRLDYSLVAPSDGIVVLSGGRHLPPGNTKIIEWYDPDRFLAGIDLYKANKSNRLIFTGGINPLSSDLPPEGDIYIKEAISMGLPKEDLFTTYPVNNTLQEAKAIKKLLNNESPLILNRIILVTSAFHMKRAKKVFENEKCLSELKYEFTLLLSQSASHLTNHTPIRCLGTPHRIYGSVRGEQACDGTTTTR